MPGIDTAVGAARGAGAVTRPLPNDAGAIVAALASEPRPAGGPAEARARAECADFLAARGFSVRDEPFTYSAFPGRWATPLCGVASALLLGSAGHLGARGDGAGALGVLVAGGLVVAAAAGWVARHGVLGLPLLRRSGVNLVAERGSVPNDCAERVWLVAHLDSKSQPVSIGARAAGVTASVAAWLSALAVGAGQALGAPLAAWWPWVSAAGAAAAVPVVLSVVGARSPGALDNASGVAAALLTADALGNEAPVGVLLTSAEELGLAGGRAWAAAARPGAAINFDGIDDAGTLTAMYTRRRPARVLLALREGARRAGGQLAERRLLPGILVDGVALADRGWEVVTLSRGTLRTLTRIHRRADSADRLTGAGVVVAARVAARAAARLTRAAEA